MTTTPTPRTKAGKRLARRIPDYFGDDMSELPSLIAEVEAEAIDGLVALREALQALVTWAEGIAGGAEPVRKARALLAGDKAKPCTGCEICVGEVDDCGCVIGHEHTCAGDKAEAPQ